MEIIVQAYDMDLLQIILDRTLVFVRLTKNLKTFVLKNIMCNH